MRETRSLILALLMTYAAIASAGDGSASSCADLLGRASQAVARNENISMYDADSRRLCSGDGIRCLMGKFSTAYILGPMLGDKDKAAGTMLKAIDMAKSVCPGWANLGDPTTCMESAAVVGASLRRAGNSRQATAQSMTFFFLECVDKGVATARRLIMGTGADGIGM